MTSDLLDVQTALRLLLEDCPLMPKTGVAVNMASGRITSEAITSTFDQPPFHSSSMDGYAVSSVDIETLPARLSVIGSSSAGHPFEGQLKGGEAVRIFTGAEVPFNADQVVIQENCERIDERTVLVKTADERGSYIRPGGYDFKAGETLIDSGARLGFRHLTLIAAMNIDVVPVRQKPKVAILATGDELIEAGGALFKGGIVSSVPAGMKALIEAAGGEAEILGIARDNLDDLREKIKRSDGFDMLVTIGGASVGEHDLVQQALKEAGLSLDFWRLAIRPGKPLMVGRLKGMRVIGVPGNPVSALVSSLLFVVPLLRQMMGAESLHLPVRQARLLNTVPTNGGRQHYMRGKASISRYGQVEVRVFDDQDSSLQRVFADANALIIRAPRAPYSEAGTLVDYISLDDI